MTILAAIKEETADMDFQILHTRLPAKQPYVFPPCVLAKKKIPLKDAFLLL